MRTPSKFGIVELTSVIYLLVLGATILQFYDYISFWILCGHALAIIVVIANCVYVQRTGQITTASFIVILCIFSVHMLNINFLGGINTPHFAWILLIPILAGATIGGRGQVFFIGLTCLGTLYYFVFPENINQLPYATDEYYVVFSRILSLCVFGLIMLSYHYTLKQKVEALDAAKREAQEISRLKSQFLANMSHELRTPLNSVIGFSETLLSVPDCTKNVERVEEYVGYINDSGKHLLTLVNDILDMAKIESGKMQLHEAEFSIVDAVTSALATLKPLIDEKKHALGIDNLDHGQQIYADERLFKQMILNLLSNAIKFTDTDGAIYIASEIDANGCICVSVEDTGRGIDSASLSKIREPFYQTENTYARSEGGTGLGLSLVTAMAALHGGSFDIESELGVGTKTILRFPKERIVN